MKKDGWSCFKLILEVALFDFREVISVYCQVVIHLVDLKFKKNKCRLEIRTKIKSGLKSSE